MVVDGSAYFAADVPLGSRLRRVGTSAVILSTSETSDTTTVSWRPGPGALPAGRDVIDVKTSICGSGSGDFWEVYGPTGSDPAEYEVTPPGDDGCWHFSDAPGTTLTVLGIALLDSTLTITSVEYLINFAPQ